MVTISLIVLFAICGGITLCRRIVSKLIDIIDIVDINKLVNKTK